MPVVGRRFSGRPLYEQSTYRSWKVALLEKNDEKVILTVFRLKKKKG
jgi:hypothetical protein